MITGINHLINCAEEMNLIFPILKRTQMFVNLWELMFHWFICYFTQTQTYPINIDRKR